MSNIVEYLKKIIKNIDRNTDLHTIAKTIDDNLVNSYGYAKNNERQEDIYTILLYCQNNDVEDNVIVDLITNIDSVQNTTIAKPSNTNNSSSIKGNTSNEKNNSSTSSSNSTANTKKESTQKDLDNTKEETSMKDTSNNEPSMVIDNNTSTNKDKETIKIESSNTTSDNASSPKNSETKTETPIIDIDTEVINDVSKDYGDIKTSIAGNKLTINNSEIKALAGDLTSLIENGNADIAENLNSLKDQMAESVASITYIDDDIKPADIKDFDFNDIWKYTGNLISSGVKIADKDFFEKCGYTVDRDIVTVGEYQYNIKNKSFSINGKGIGKAYFYIPTGTSDYSKLNTLTLLCQESRNQDVGNSSNSIIIALDNGDSSYLKKPSNVSSVTKFMNQVAKTDLNKCQNIITGGSRFGARSLKIAAESGDLYQTVICVNNAAIVKGVNGGNGSQKESFESIEQLQKLNGKNIYFISSKEDPNLTMLYNKKSEIARNNDVTKCYVYTGMNLILDNCPDSQVYFISNSDNPEFANISAPNYNYGKDLWGRVAKSNDYATHGTLHNILNDMCSSNLVGYNAYNSSNITGA